MRDDNYKWDINEYGGLECPCGNNTDKSGFFACDENGILVEPVESWGGLCKCMECERVEIGQDLI